MRQPQHDARALMEPANQQGSIAIAERLSTDLEGFELWWGPVSHEGPLVKARLGVGQAFDQHAALGRIAKAAEAHRVILSGVVRATDFSGQEDPLDGLDDEVGSVFNPAGTIARKGQNCTVSHEPIRTHPSA